MTLRLALPDARSEAAEASARLGEAAEWAGLPEGMREELRKTRQRLDEHRVDPDPAALARIVEQLEVAQIYLDAARLIASEDARLQAELKKIWGPGWFWQMGLARSLRFPLPGISPRAALWRIALVLLPAAIWLLYRAWQA
jgi:hypothetical protein